MDSGQIFKPEEGRQLKFFIQKDLDEKLIEELYDQITANGGRVQAKVPMQGFVLIEPNSREGTRLIGCWSTADRPLRHFVPYTFVKACLEARKVLPQIFRKGEQAIRFHLHSCITNERTLETLRARIWHSGGDPTAPEEQANVIIADESLPIFRTLLDRYEHSRDKFVEPIYWVKQCIMAEACENTPVVKKNLGGRPTGIKRKEFTERDDTNLASYIARRLPDPTMRGRTGNKIYQDLCSRLDLYPWAEHHPWQSWRERYKNNIPRFSRLIAVYAEKLPPSENGKGLHGFVRAPSASQPGAKGTTDHDQRAAGEADYDVEWDGSQWKVTVGTRSPPPWSPEKRGAGRTHDCLESPTKRRKIQTEHVDERDVTIQTADGSRTSLPPLSETIPSQGSSQESGVHINTLEPAHEPESGNLGSLTQAPTPNMGSISSRTRSGSPYDLELGDNQQAEVDSDDNILGAQTQAFLSAHRDMLEHTPSSFRSKATPGEVAQSKPGRKNTSLNGETTTAVTSPHDDSGVQRTAAPIPSAKSSDGSNHGLVHIACKYRFLLDEVEEVHREFGSDILATAKHFREAREFMTTSKSKWHSGSS